MTTSSQIKTNKQTTSNKSFKQVTWDSVKTPNTVEQFKENLKKYFMTVTCPKGNTSLVTQQEWVDLRKFTNMDDIYKLTKTGWCGSGESFKITPLFESLYDGGRIFESITSDNSKLIKELEKESFTFMWVRMDNQIYRELFVKILGEFSGYMDDTQFKFPNTVKEKENVI